MISFKKQSHGCKVVSDDFGWTEVDLNFLINKKMGNFISPWQMKVFTNRLEIGAPVVTVKRIRPRQW